MKTAKKQDFKRLPFDCCGLSLRPTVNPYITREGHLFDFVNIFPYIKKFGINPVTGGKLEAKDLIKVRFHKDTDGKYHCPVLFEPFHDNSHIVVIAVSGNVYCMRAIKELCINNKNMKDLKTEKSFVKEDIIELQNPACLEKFNFTMFDYLKKGIDVKNIIKGEAYDDGWMNGSKTTTSSLNCTTNEVGATLKELNDNWQGDGLIKKLAVDYDGMQMKPAMGGDHKAGYSTGMVSTSFTSTRMSRHVENRTAIRDDAELRNQWVKKKGYCQVITSLGPLNFELHCDMIPLACENFIKHSISGYYDNTKFHRLVPDFMVQGGDPTGTGKGGESIFPEGKDKTTCFKDEYRQSLKFNQRGMLAMANNGRHTNKSQFFITFSPQEHLDRMHTIFGKLVGGQEVLNAIENEKRDSGDRPVNDIVIFRINVMVNPFEQADEKIAQLKADEKIKYDKEIQEKQRLDVKRKERMEAITRATEQGIELEELLQNEKDEAIANKPKGVGRYLGAAVSKLKEQADPVKQKIKATKSNSKTPMIGGAALAKKRIQISGKPKVSAETAKKMAANRKKTGKTSFSDFSGW